MDEAVGVLAVEVAGEAAVEPDGVAAADSGLGPMEHATCSAAGADGAEAALGRAASGEPMLLMEAEMVMLGTTAAGAAEQRSWLLRLFWAVLLSAALSLFGLFASLALLELLPLLEMLCLLGGEPAVPGVLADAPMLGISPLMDSMAMAARPRRERTGGRGRATSSVYRARAFWWEGREGGFEMASRDLVF